MDKYFFATIILIVLSISIIFYIRTSTKKSSSAIKASSEDTDSLTDLKADDLTILS